MTNTCLLPAGPVNCSWPEKVAEKWSANARPESAADRRRPTDSSHALHGQAHRFPAPEADGRDPPPDFALLHGVEQRGEDPRPARADRVSQRDRSAVDVHAFHIEPDVPGDRDDDGGVRLVDLVEIDRLPSPPDL